MGGSYRIVAVIGYESVCYMQLYSFRIARTLTVFVCKSSTLMVYIEIRLQLFERCRQVFA